MGILRNRYLRVAIAASVASVAAPKVMKLFDWALPDLKSPAGSVVSDIEYFSVVGILAGMTAVVLGTVFGAPEGESAPKVPGVAA